MTRNRRTASSGQKGSIRDWRRTRSPHQGISSAENAHSVSKSTAAHRGPVSVSVEEGARYDASCSLLALKALVPRLLEPQRDHACAEGAVDDPGPAHTDLGERWRPAEPAYSYADRQIA